MVLVNWLDSYFWVHSAHMSTCFRQPTWVCGTSLIAYYLAIQYNMIYTETDPSGTQLSAVGYDLNTLHNPNKHPIRLRLPTLLFNLSFSKPLI